MHYQWWSIDVKKKKMILWKLSCIWMKIWNDIACNLNWIEIQFNTYLIEFELSNGMQIDAQGAKIWMWIWCWEKKTHIWKKHIPIPLHFEIG
jgi:hypothetical protein